jgi:hypothetical protein
MVLVGMRAHTVRQICQEQIWTCALQHGREAMEYMDVFHNPKRLPKSQYLAGLFCI